MNKEWRPTNWNHLKNKIIAESPVIFSPNMGTIGNQNTIIEKTASTIIEAVLAEQAKNDR